MYGGESPMYGGENRSCTVKRIDNVRWRESNVWRRESIMYGEENR